MNIKDFITIYSKSQYGEKKKCISLSKMHFLNTVLQNDDLRRGRIRRPLPKDCLINGWIFGRRRWLTTDRVEVYAEGGYAALCQKTA